jgi:hypothetical protein
MREEFLKSFVFEMVKNSYKPRKIEPMEIWSELGNIPSVQARPARLMPRPQANLPSTSAPLGMIPSMMSSPPPQIPQFSMELPPYQAPALKPGQLPEAVNLGRVSKILMDPSVFAVECAGPSKNILVNRAGTIQTSAVILSDQEIQTILNEFSEKTRIPLGSNVFRAVFQDLLITAVISEFVGTRFVIQKRTPFQKF